MCHYIVKENILQRSKDRIPFLAMEGQKMMSDDMKPAPYISAAEAVCNVEIPGVCSWDSSDDDGNEDQ